MTPREKLQAIEEKIKLLNESVLKHKNWKLGYVNKGRNNYCLTIIVNNKELFCGKCDTYGSVLSCLELMEFMFSKALEEKQKGRKIKRK